MSLADVLAGVEASRPSITIYSPADHPDELDQFATRARSVDHRPLPEGSPEGFLVVRDADGFAGALSLTDLRALLARSIGRPWDTEELDPGYRALFALLDDTLFVSLERRHLLAASREIEDRAWRVGRGTLRAAFQHRRALRAQADVYASLAEETDLDVHVYYDRDNRANGGDDPPSIPGATVHADGGEVGNYWVLAFDGGDDPSQQCALVAEQWGADTYFGFWTYDPGVVADVLAALETW